jgi:hypothetical protein
MQPTPVPWLKQAAAEVAPTPFPSQDGALPSDPAHRVAHALRHSKKVHRRQRNSQLLKSWLIELLSSLQVKGTSSWSSVVCLSQLWSCSSSSRANLVDQQVIVPKQGSTA